MLTTKIINVLKNDTFDDVFETFTTTEAQEVILIFPKGSKVGRNDENFTQLAEAAATADKHISIMTSDPVIAQLASNSGMALLEQRSPKKIKTSTKKAIQPTQHQNSVSDDPEEVLLSPEVIDDSEYRPHNIDYEPEIEQSEDHTSEQSDLNHEEHEESDYDHGDSQPEAFLATTHTSHARAIKDILKHQKDFTIPIKKTNEKPEDIFVNVQKSTHTKADKDIAKMWQTGLSHKKLIQVKEHLLSSRLTKIIPVFFIIAALAGGVAILSSAASKALVTIEPHKQKIEFQIKVTASTHESSVNTNDNRIPGQQFDKEEAASDTFPATGHKDIAQKATGTITIHNTGNVSQKLVATTRFESSDGLIFRINSSVVVPAGSDTNPGSVQAKIYADRPGPEYNIKPTKFTIPGFKDTDKFDVFSAISDTPTTGGTAGPAKVVTEQDFNQAQQKLTSVLKDKIPRLLAQQGEQLKIIQPRITFDDPTTNAAIGEAADTLQMSIKAHAKTIAFRESDVAALIQNYIAKNNNLIVASPSLSITYQPQELGADPTNLVFIVKVSADGFSQLDKDKILRDIRGMSEPDIQHYFKAMKDIDSVRILLSPFWVHHIPANGERINIQIKT